MPFADDLYSADDSDVESFSEELSPTDGYFSPRNLPHNVMVLDPSLQEGAVESKAREAQRESEASQAGHFAGSDVVSQTISTSEPFRYSSTAYSPTSTSSNAFHPQLSPPFRRDESYTEASSLLHPAPPPAYSAATSQPTSSLSRGFHPDYRTISTRHLEEGEVYRHEPESMGNPVAVEEQPPPAWMIRIKKLQSRSILKKILLVFLVSALGIGFLVTGIKNNQSHKNTGDIVPADPQLPTTPEAPQPPGTPGMQDGKPISYCKTTTNNINRDLPVYQFETGKSFRIMQVDYDSGSSEAPKTRIAGKVIFRRLRTDAHSSTTGQVTFNVWGHGTHGPGPQVNIDEDGNAVSIKVPRQTPLGGEEQCLSIEVTVWLPENSTFDVLQCFTTQLDIEVYDDININVFGQIFLQTFVGNIILPQANETDLAINPLVTQQRGLCGEVFQVDTATGSITGTFYLCDNLKLVSQSGNIDVVVLPQESKKGPKAVASLQAETTSGHLRVRYPIGDNYSPPARDYHTDIQSESGSIDGSYYLGSTLKLDTKSGSMHIEVLPVPSYKTSEFTTESYSGSIQISMLSPPSKQNAIITQPGKPKYADVGNDDPYLINPTRSGEYNAESRAIGKIRQLRSYHASNSGSIFVRYPDEWEGEIDATSIAGHLRVRGPEVRIIKDGRRSWAYNEIIARKGSNAGQASKMKVELMAGGADVWVGEGCENVGSCK